MKTTEWMNGNKIDSTMSARAAELFEQAEDLVHSRSMAQAADAYEVAADCYEMAGDMILVIRMRKYAGICRVQAA